MTIGTECVSGRMQGNLLPSTCKDPQFQANTEGGLGYYRAWKGGVHVLGLNDNALMVAENWKH
jgi:hypothetical protein